MPTRGRRQALGFALGAFFGVQLSWGFRVFEGSRVWEFGVTVPRRNTVPKLQGFSQLSWVRRHVKP